MIHARRKYWLKVLSAMLVIPGAVLLILVALDRFYPVPINRSDSPSVRIMASDNGVLRVFTNAKGNYRLQTEPLHVSANYLEALLAYEDKSFYRHPGFNPFSMLRALWQWWHFGHVVSGGSTLTMQVARLLEPHSRSCAGKVRQLLRAVQLEWHFSKQQILSLYLNYAPFGSNLIGVEAAAYGWLGKSAQQLTDAEAALLVVLPQAPGRLRPDRFPLQAQKARDKVLKRVAVARRWPEGRMLRACSEPVPDTRQFFPCHAAWLSRQLQQSHSAISAVKTTLNIDIQNALEDYISIPLSDIPHATQLGVLIVSNQHAEVAACGSFCRDGNISRADRVTVISSPGSTIKPFIYGMAMDDGLVHSETLLADLPWDFNGYRPVNFSGGFCGAVSLADALKLSLNVPVVQVFEQLQPSVFMQRLQHAGIKLVSDEPGLGLALGAGGINLESLVRMYLALAREGRCPVLRYFPGKPLEEKPLLSSASAWIIRKLLEDISLPGRVDLDGQKHIAWKSGTSYGHRDVWAIGVGSEYTVGISMGRADGAPQPELTGPETAGDLLFDIFDLLPDSGCDYRHPKPDNVEQAEINRSSGRRCMTEQRQWQEVRTAWLIDGRAPVTQPVITGRLSYLADQYLHILSPRGGMKVAAGPHRLPLISQGGQGEINWYCNGLLLGRPELDLLLMRRGVYKLTAVDSEGALASIAIQLL